MKVYISVDFEGGACIVGNSGESLGKATGQYELSRRVMTNEANACAKAAFDGGATEVIVDDCHGGGLNFFFEELLEDVKVLMGRSRPSRFAPVDDSFSAVALIGYHPMAGTKDGILSHTYSSAGIQNMYLNDRRIGEIGLDAAILGERGVPVILVSSDEAGCREAEEFIPGVETTATKKGIGRNAAISLTPKKACKVIYDGMLKAMGRIKEIKPVIVSPPYALKIEYKLEHFAEKEWMTAFTGERIDARTEIRRIERLNDIF